ncbi:MAG: DUF3147 family protein [Actinomycetota bacterium]|nr:DUF3147 family protein [Actinomycetota bacterium]
MPTITILALRAAVGGTLVVTFSLIAEVVKPKAFAGLFASAPSVAVASLAITAASEGVHRAAIDSTGMVVGAVGMATCCLVAATAIPRIGALKGSAVAWVAWLIAALGLYWAVFVGARR